MGTQRLATRLSVSARVRFGALPVVALALALSFVLGLPAALARPTDSPPARSLSPAPRSGKARGMASSSGTATLRRPSSPAACSATLPSSTPATPAAAASS